MAIHDWLIFLLYNLYCYCAGQVVEVGASVLHIGNYICVLSNTSLFSSQCLTPTCLIYHLACAAM